MNDDVPQTVSKQPKLTLASKNIWYALATIAGERNQGKNAKNSYYWNGYMRLLASPEELKRFEKNTTNLDHLPILTPKDMVIIRESLSDRGFREVDLKLQGFVNWENIHFPEVNFSNFIFLKYVKLDGSKFSGHAKFSNCMFAEAGTFSGANFSKGASFASSTFYKDAWFLSCDFLGSLFLPKSSFYGTALFVSCKFLKDINFDETLFSERALFSGSIFSV